MIALIAGAGHLPMMAIQALKIDKKDFFVVALCEENNGAQLARSTGSSYECIVMNVLKVGAILDLLKQKQCTHILFVGKVNKQILLKKVSLDWLGLKLMGSLLGKSDREIMETIIAFLAKHNMKTLSQSQVLSSLHVPPGTISGTLTPQIKHDINLGMQTAQNISSCDIGQTVIIKNGMIIAIEAIEGTDECIKRGITLAHNNIIICKAARLDHNRQYDLPTLGPSTLKNIAPGEVAAIAWQSSHTLIVDQDNFIAQAQSRNIILISV